MTNQATTRTKPTLHLAATAWWIIPGIVWVGYGYHPNLSGLILQKSHKITEDVSILTICGMIHQVERCLPMGFQVDFQIRGIVRNLHKFRELGTESTCSPNQSWRQLNIWPFWNLLGNAARSYENVVKMWVAFNSNNTKLPSGDEQKLPTWSHGPVESSWVFPVIAWGIFP